MCGKLTRCARWHFCRIARVVAQLDHPNVVKLKAFYEDADRFFLVMENMKGGELLRQIERRTRFREEDARDVVVTLLKAIRYCHALGIVHRDLKVRHSRRRARGIHQHACSPGPCPRVDAVL